MRTLAPGKGGPLREAEVRYSDGSFRMQVVKTADRGTSAEQLKRWLHTLDELRQLGLSVPPARMVRVDGKEPWKGLLMDADSSRLVPVVGKGDASKPVAFQYLYREEHGDIIEDLARELAILHNAGYAPTVFNLWHLLSSKRNFHSFHLLDVSSLNRHSKTGDVFQAHSRAGLRACAEAFLEPAARAHFIDAYLADIDERVGRQAGLIRHAQSLRSVRKAGG